MTTNLMLACVVVLLASGVLSQELEQGPGAPLIPGPQLQQAGQSVNSPGPRSGNLRAGRSKRSFYGFGYGLGYGYGYGYPYGWGYGYGGYGFGYPYGGFYGGYYPGYYGWW